jgi:lipopolysaccharide biosynthesis regulator YciM
VRPAGAAPEILPSDEAAGMLARAEDFFAQGEMENAVRAYAAVADSGDRRYAPYASYKLAWCYGNLQEHVNALQRMTDVLRMIDPPQDEQERRLRREAVRDLAFFFAQVARPEQAAAFFRRVMRPEEVREALERLAETYRDEGRGRDEADVREQLRLLDL